MNRALRDQICAIAKQEGAEFYEGFAGSPNSINFKEDELWRFVNSINFKEDEFWRFVSRLWQEAYDRGHDEGYDAGQTAAESQAAFAARNEE